MTAAVVPCSHKVRPLFDWDVKTELDPMTKQPSTRGHKSVAVVLPPSKVRHYWHYCSYVYANAASTMHSCRPCLLPVAGMNLWRQTQGSEQAPHWFNPPAALHTRCTLQAYDVTPHPPAAPHPPSHHVPGTAAASQQQHSSSSVAAAAT